MHLGSADRARSADKLRVNPRKAWYNNLAEVKTDGDYEVTFVLKRPQPAFIALLASRHVAGLSLPCVGGADAPAPDRHRPVQVRRVQAERVDQAGRRTRITGSRACPISTASNTRSSRNRSTVILAFIAGQYDLTFAGSVSVPLMHDIQNQRPDATCVLPGGSVSTNLIVNRTKPPFDNADLRRAMALTIDRKAFIDILTEGTGQMAAAMQPPKAPRAASGACRRRCWQSCPATTRISRRTAPRRARSCKSSATARTTGSRSRSSRATSRPIAIRR